MSNVRFDSSPTSPPSRRPDAYRRWGKRLFDVLAAASLLLLLGPVMLVVAALVAWRLGRPVLFRQRRPGKQGAPFEMVKFRSMTDRRDDQGELLPDEQRLTRLGNWLRASSLDELPELFNVLRGDMSMVGPRPLLMRYLERYSPNQFRRHEVHPGVTGWAQVNGRNAISWDEKFAYDVWYVDHYNFWVDLRILARTVFGVLNRSGISAEGYATMPEFEGQGADSVEDDDLMT